MRWLPRGLFAAAALVLLAVHFVHQKDILLDHGSLGRIRGENVTRAFVCSPLAVVACFVAFNRRFDRKAQAFCVLTLGIGIASWFVLIFTN